MKEEVFTFIQLSPHSGLGLGLLIIGALFTAGVGLSVFSFYLDEYWEDETYREKLRIGEAKSKSIKRQRG